MRQRLSIILLVLLGLALPAYTPQACAIYNEPADAAPVGDADFDAGFAAVKKEDWQNAINRLELAAKKHPRSADIFNLLGYAYRKTGNLERSFPNYHRALELDPSHRGAHEYIGEAWLMQGNVAKAREHLRELERLCRADCGEYRDLDHAIAEFEKRATQVPQKVW